MSYLEESYPESKFGGFSDQDGTIAFYNRVNALLKKDFTVLNIGCGRGSFIEDKSVYRKNLQSIRGKAKKIIGIDIDEIAKNNPDIDSFHLIRKGCFPIKSESVDFGICDQVLEHVENPNLFFSECQRVLKKNGYLCLRTTNNWGYIGLMARIIPFKKHAKALKMTQKIRQKRDVFPKFYRANSIPRLKKILQKNNFDYCLYGFSGEPTYFSFSKILYKLGVILHRLIPNFFKPTIFVFAKKR